VVDASSVSDGEHPASKVIRVAVEPAEVAGDADKDVTEEVFGLVDAVRPEVAEDGRSENAVTLVERR
jgi:hypothetical protein